VTDTEPPILKEAEELFETEFRPHWQESVLCNFTASFEDETLALGLLGDVGLVAREGSLIKVGPIGKKVLSGFLTTRQAIINHVSPPQPSHSPVTITATNIGALSTGSHGQAHGSVTVRLETDKALLRLIELQDELGALSDELWSVLRRVRDLEIKGGDLKEAVDTIEIERFREAMKTRPDLSKVLKTVFEASPTLLKLWLGIQES
jgi:hypothetical protein